MQNSLYLLCFLQLGELKVLNSLYLLRFLQFGGLTSAKSRIFTVRFAMWRAKQMQNILYLLWVLQFEEVTSAK